MATLENLPADQRAVLQLVLQRGRSYGEIARLLSIDSDAVRQRAAAALGALGPQTGLDDTRRGVITDYLLGQLDPAEADAARGTIGAAPGERAWARVVASELAPLASAGLPEIPSAGPAPVPRPPVAPPPAASQAPPVADEPRADADAPAPRERKPREPLFLGRKRNQGERAPKPAKAARPPKTPKAKKPREPLFLGRKRNQGERAQATPPALAPKVPLGDDDTERSSLFGGAVLILLTAVIVAAIVVILISSGGSANTGRGKVASHSASPTATSSAPAASATTTTSASSSAKVVAQINLTPPSGKSKSAGIAEVLKEGASDGIAIVAQNVPANTTKPPNAYAVWLYNSASDSHLLGFVNPGVGANGRLSTAGGLPTNASHYKQLIVTLETKASPKTPGQIILQGALTGV